MSFPQLFAFPWGRYRPHRVRTDSKILFSRTFRDLQRPNSRVFQDSQNSFSKTFQDKFGSQTWLHKVQKCTYQISYQCNCITVTSPNAITEIQTDPKGNKLHTAFYNEFLLKLAILVPEINISRTITLEFQDFSRVFQDLCLLPGLSRPGNLNILMP